MSVNPLICSYFTPSFIPLQSYPTPPFRIWPGSRWTILYYYMVHLCPDCIMYYSPFPQGPAFCYSSPVSSCMWECTERQMFFQRCHKMNTCWAHVIKTSYLTTFERFCKLFIQIHNLFYWTHLCTMNILSIAQCWGFSTMLITSSNLKVIAVWKSSIEKFIMKYAQKRGSLYFCVGFSELLFFWISDTE